MIPLCHQYSRCFQRYDTLNRGNAEKIDCEKNSFEVDSLCLPKTETIDRHTLSLALRKFATISVSFRTLHIPLSWMESLTKQ